MGLRGRFMVRGFDDWKGTVLAARSTSELAAFTVYSDRISGTTDSEYTLGATEG